MERKDYKRYSREFKLEAVRLAAVGDRPKAQIARELGIRVNQLRKRRLDFEAEERTGAPRPAPVVDEDLGQLRRENTKLREENEILKKAAIYFARQSLRSINHRLIRVSTVRGEDQFDCAFNRSTQQIDEIVQLVFGS